MVRIWRWSRAVIWWYYIVPVFCACNMWTRRECVDIFAMIGIAWCINLYKFIAASSSLNMDRNSNDCIWRHLDLSVHFLSEFISLCPFWCGRSWINGLPVSIWCVLINMILDISAVVSIDWSGDDSTRWREGLCCLFFVIWEMSAIYMYNARCWLCFVVDSGRT